MNKHPRQLWLQLHRRPRGATILSVRAAAVLTSLMVGLTGCFLLSARGVAFIFGLLFLAWAATTAWYAWQARE